MRVCTFVSLLDCVIRSLRMWWYRADLSLRIFMWD